MARDRISPSSTYLLSQPASQPWSLSSAERYSRQRTDSGFRPSGVLWGWGNQGEEACLTTLGSASCLICAVCPTWAFEDREEEHLSAVLKSPHLESVTRSLPGVQLTKLPSFDDPFSRAKLRIGWTWGTEQMGSSLCFLLCPRWGRMYRNEPPCLFCRS